MNDQEPPIIKPGVQKFWTNMAEVFSRDKDLSFLRKQYLDEWSAKPLEEIEREIKRVRQDVINQEEMDGDLEGERLSPMWQLSALQEALDNAKKRS